MRNWFKKYDESAVNNLKAKIDLKVKIETDDLSISSVILNQ